MKKTKHSLINQYSNDSKKPVNYYRIHILNKYKSLIKFYFHKKKFRENYLEYLLFFQDKIALYNIIFLIIRQLPEWKTRFQTMITFFDILKKSCGIFEK